jgi:hypothetical protein
MPIGVICDTTGSMADVPIIIQKALPRLMGTFLNAKASGEKYLGDYYPAILVGAVDDFTAMRSYPNSEGTLQISQFESGIELDDHLTNLWLTGHGGGTYEESYDLALYFFARHTATDHWEKRGSKGYLFIIGDEMPYSAAHANEIKTIIGDTLQGDIPIAELMKEIQQRWHVFFIIPNMTSHYGDPALTKAWLKYLPQQNVLRLEDPEKICELIASTVAISEEHIGIDDLATDGVAAGGVSQALVPLSRAAKDLVASGLPLSAGAAVTRL